MKKVVMFAILLVTIIVSYAIATNGGVDTSDLVEVKESHFQKHIEFWTVVIIFAIGGLFYLYKRRD